MPTSLRKTWLLFDCRRCGQRFRADPQESWARAQARIDATIDASNAYHVCEDGKGKGVAVPAGFSDVD